MPINSVIRDIKSLKIQGATNVAIAAIDVMQEVSLKSKAKTKATYIKELSSAAKKLAKTRPTEPMMRNGLRYILHLNLKRYDLNELRQVVKSKCEEFRGMILSSKNKIADIGSAKIEPGMTVLTHCHSSTVLDILKVAKQKGINVICTETRPRFQGRITAKELISAGIKTRMIVDSAARFYMNKVDMVLVGADVITSEGNILNKIGTGLIAMASYDARTRFYVASTILKFDPATTLGSLEEIEHRSPREVWESPPRGLKILNPAFEVTPRNFIDGIVTESGVFAPEMMYQIVSRDYGWIFNEIR
jgi:ribose 1,5-bisphosphate isomerase